MVSERDRESAESDLIWFFADAAAALGFHGQSGEPGTGFVFDDMASDELHALKHSWRHRHAAARLRRVAPLVDAMGSEHRKVVELAFTPHAWPNAMRMAFTARRGVCLASLAIRTKACARLRDSRGKGESTQDFLVFETGQCDHAKRLPQRLAAIKAEAESMLEEALAAYNALRGMPEMDVAS